MTLGGGERSCGMFSGCGAAPRFERPGAGTKSPVVSNGSLSEFEDLRNALPGTVLRNFGFPGSRSTLGGV